MGERIAVRRNHNGSNQRSIDSRVNVANDDPDGFLAARAADLMDHLEDFAVALGGERSVGRIRRIMKRQTFPDAGKLRKGEYPFSCQSLACKKNLN
jgi:hypothetical protein